MERTPAYLAALASAAVPGLDPVTVEALRRMPEQHFDVAFVVDAQDRRWVVRAPRDEAAGARMDQSYTLLTLLGRRLPFAVPSPRGFVGLKEGGRAAVYPWLPGRSVDLSALPAGRGPAGELGRAIAAIHNTDPRLFEEAGAEIYDADVYRLRRLAEVDRAAGTGQVPRGLLARWEQALEDVSLWRFAATPVHGGLRGQDVLMVFDGDDLSGARVKAVLRWEDAMVADPALDFAELLALAPSDAMDTVLEAYAHSRVERPDRNLLVRARLANELNQLAAFTAAVGRGDTAAVEVLSTHLRRLDDEVHGDAGHDTSLAPVQPRPRPVAPAPVTDDENVDEPAEDVEDTAPDDEPDAAFEGDTGPQEGTDDVTEFEHPDEVADLDELDDDVHDDVERDLDDDDDQAHALGARPDNDATQEIDVPAVLAERSIDDAEPGARPRG